MILASDYLQYRKDEPEGQQFIGFLQRQLEGKFALFIGFDTGSEDFRLLMKHILNEQLGGLNFCVYSIGAGQEEAVYWDQQQIWPLDTDFNLLIQQLSQTK